MSEDNSHESTGSRLQRILQRIPGFGGYGDSSLRRENEAKANQWITQHLERGKQVIDRFARTLADHGQFDILPRCDRIRGQLDLLMTRMRSTPVDRSGFYARPTLDEELLEDLYEYDLWLMDEAEQLAKDMESASASGDEVQKVLQEFERQVSVMEAKWRGRQKLIDVEP